MFLTATESYPLSMHKCSFTPQWISRDRIRASLRVVRSKRMSCTLAPPTAKPVGIPAASVSNDRFVPDFARSVGFFPVDSPPRVLWLSRRRRSANANRDPPNRRITRGRFAKALRRCPVAPIPGNRRVPYCLEQDSWESLSIGNPYVVGRKLRPRRIVNLSVVCLRADRSRNQAEADGFFPTSHLAFGTHRSYSVIPW